MFEFNHSTATENDVVTLLKKLYAYGCFNTQKMRFNAIQGRIMAKKTDFYRKQQIEKYQKMLGVFFDISGIENDFFQVLEASGDCPRSRFAINEYRSYYQIIEKWFPVKVNGQLAPGTKVLNFWQDNPKNIQGYEKFKQQEFVCENKTSPESQNKLQGFPCSKTFAPLKIGDTNKVYKGSNTTQVGDDVHKKPKLSLLLDQTSECKNLNSCSDQPQLVVDLCENSASQETKSTDEKA
jgi:hypothetical protein